MAFDFFMLFNIIIYSHIRYALSVNKLPNFLNKGQLGKTGIIFLTQTNENVMT